MTEEVVLDVASEALWTIIIVSAPLLLISLIIGLLVSIFQAITSIQEQTLTFIPKFLAIFICIMLFGSFIINKVVGLMESLWMFGDYIA